MNEKEFIDWLKGFTSGVHHYSITPAQWDHLKEVLQNYLNPSDDAETSTETTSTNEQVSEKTETKQTADVSDAFDELFNS